MVKTYAAPDDAEATCTSCGVEFKSPVSPRNRRIACPKCREAVLLEHPSEPVPAKKGRAPSETEAETDRSGTEVLESRVAALEAAVAALIVASSATEHADSGKKLQWAGTGTADPPGEFSPEKVNALAHNLGTAKTREITFRVPAGDAVAGGRAGSLMKIFELAGWKVRGPVDAAPGSTRKTLVLGVPTVPVSKEAAEIYLALKAAGFEPLPVLDPTLANSGEASSLSLSLSLPAADQRNAA